MTDSQSGEPVLNGGVPTSNDQARGDDKPWLRAWEPNEVRHRATDWSLAADAGLLKYLQAFSTRFMAKAHESTLGINDLVHETNMMDARMRNVADRFLTLSDSQFIENRVYDEDVSEDANGDSSDKSKEEKKDVKKEIDPFPKLKEAIQSGLKVLDDVFDVLDANAVHSDYDSDLDSDEEDGQGVNGMPTKLYEPKDPYVVRPLPHLIGSRGFLESDDVGIKDLPSDDEVQDDEGSISESDDDVEKPNSEKKDSSSDYDSDTEYSEDEDKVAPADSAPKEQRLSSESEDEDLFGKKSEDDFSEDEEASLPEKKRAPSKSKPSPKQKKKKDKPKKPEPDLFADDEEGDDLFANSGGLFGTGANLFGKKKTKGDGLFDDADVSDEGSDIESDKEQEEMENKSQDLSSEEEEAEESEVPPEKSSKPLGGVSLFGGALNKELLSRRRQDTDSSSQASEKSSKNASNLFLDEDEDDLFSSKPPPKPKSNAQPKPQPKVKSILSDSEDEVKPPPIEKKLPSKDKKKSASVLFGSESDEDDLFGGGLPEKSGPQKTSAPPTSKKKETPKPNIFDSGSSDDDDDSMFSKNPPAMEAPAKLVSKSRDVFDSDSDDDFFAHVESKATKKANITQPKPLLESDSDGEDMFSSIPPTKIQPKVADAGNKDTVTTEIKRDKPVAKPKSDNLFDDDSEEQESENEKEEDEPLPSQKKKPVGAVSMFGGGFGGAELSAAISKRRAVSDISTKSSSSTNDSDQPKETKKNLGLFGDEEDEDVKKKHYSPKMEEKTAEKIESEPKKETQKPTPHPKVIVNVTAKPFGKTALSSTPDPDAADSSKAQPFANVTAKPFKPFGTRATPPKTDSKASSSPPKSSVGKLRAGLAINPSSLLPGAAPKPKPVIQAEISFDEPPVVKTLDSFNKARSRGQRNRRPPSRHFKGNLVVVDDKSGAPTFVEETLKEEKKTENVGGNAVKNEQKPVDLPQKEESMDIPVKKTTEEPKNITDSAVQIPVDLAQKEGPVDTPVKKQPKEKPKNLIDSADLDDELFSGSLFTKSDKKPKTKAKAPKLFDDDIFGDADDFLNDLMPGGKKEDKGEGLKVVDLSDNDDIFGDLSEGGIFSKPNKKETLQKGNLEEDDIFGDIGDESKAKQTKLDEDIFGDFASSIDAKPKGEVKAKSSKPIHDSDIFGGDDFDFSLPKSKSDKKEDIFSSDDKPAGKSPKIEKKKKPAAAAKDDDIFGDDIFSDMPSKPAPKKTTKKVEKKQKSSKPAAGASIFDDDGDVSDIFASSSVKKKVKNPISKTRAPKKTEKETTSTVMDDPLSMP